MILLLMKSLHYYKLLGTKQYSQLTKELIKIKGELKEDPFNFGSFLLLKKGEQFLKVQFVELFHLNVALFSLTGLSE